jgi:RNA polymerase sigma-70 factor (ECF subfamily)
MRIGGFEELFGREYASVARTVFLIVRDEGGAQDLAQDAFIELFRRWRKVSRYDRPEAWVRRVAVNRAIDHLRKERKRATVEREALAPVADEGGDPDVSRAIGSLPAQQRAAVVLFYLEDLPVTEVAAILGCSTSTAGVHLHRGRRRLAELLGEEVPDDAAG